MSSLPQARRPEKVRFDVYEIDPRAGELRKHGYRVPLEDRPFRALEILLQHAPEVVTREELQKKLWPADVFVDFDHGLNKAIGKVRRALNDSADDPRFVETVGRRGYRFIAPLARPVSTPLSPIPVAVAQLQAAVRRRLGKRNSRKIPDRLANLALGGSAAVAALLTAFLFRPANRRSPDRRDCADHEVRRSLAA